MSKGIYLKYLPGKKSCFPQGHRLKQSYVQQKETDSLNFLVIQAIVSSKYRWETSFSTYCKKSSWDRYLRIIN